jgi:hypothetical protein
MKALRYCTALYGFGDLFSRGHATPSHGIQPASSWDVQDVKPLTLSNVAFGSKTELSPLALHVRSGSKTDSNHEGSMSALPSTADFTKVTVRSAKCRQQRTSRTTSRRRSGKPALIFRCFQIDDMGPVPCVNFLGEQSTRSANAKP